MTACDIKDCKNNFMLNTKSYCRYNEEYIFLKFSKVSTEACQGSKKIKSKKSELKSFLSEMKKQNKSIKELKYLLNL
jgi:hypothetical protein